MATGISLKTNPFFFVSYRSHSGNHKIQHNIMCVSVLVFDVIYIYIYNGYIFCIFYIFPIRRHIMTTIISLLDICSAIDIVLINKIKQINDF